MDIRKTVKSANIKHQFISTDWRNGLLLGNGSLASVAYAPGDMEWLVNKNDVFDRRIYELSRLLTHAEVMDRVRKGERETFAFDEIERRTDNYSLRSITPCILRLCNGNGELGWAAPAFPKISAELDIYDGELRTVSDAHFVHSRTCSVIPRNRALFAVRMEGCAIIDWTHKIELYRPYHDDMDAPIWHDFGNGTVAFEQELPGGLGKYAVALVVVVREPDISRVSYTLPSDFDFSKLKSGISALNVGKLASFMMNEGDVDIFLSVYSDYDAEEPLSAALAEVRAAAELGFDAIRDEANGYWHDFWEKSCFDFGKYFEIGRNALFSAYELASSYSRAPMPALSGMLYGPLNPTTPGVSAHSYTSDQNIQIPLMPAPIIGHPELVIPLADTFMNGKELMRAHTERLFGEGAKGIFIPLVSNQNGAELSSASYRFTMCGGAYVGLIFARTWEYSACDGLMRDKFYPLLSEIVRFYVSNMMHLESDGRYHLDPTVPPEIFLFTKDETSTLAMLKVCLRVALLWCENEGIENEETALWRDVLSKYPDISKRSDGAWWCGPEIPEEHFTFATHILYPFFPSEEYLSESDREATERLIEYIDREAIERTYAGPHGWHFIHDWSWHLYYSTLAHLGEKYKERVWEQLKTFINYFAKANGLFTHNSIVNFPSQLTEANHEACKRRDEITADYTTGPDWYGSGKCATPNIYSAGLTAPVIEGNSIFLLRALETLIQSFDGIIRLFPGVPDGFTGEFKNLSARGGFTVSAKMTDGRLAFATVTAKRCSILRLPDDGRYAVKGKTPVKAVHHGIAVNEYSVKAGEAVEVVSA